MRKVIKYSLHTLSFIVLGAIALPVTAMLLLYLPPVQRAATKKVTAMASEFLGTKVTVERIGIDFFNRLTLHGLYVEDLGADTLLYARRLSAGFTIKGLAGSPLRLGDVELDGARLYMHQDPDSTSNLRKIIDPLRNPDNKDKKSFSLKARSLTIRDMAYRMRKLDVVPRGGAVNFTDIDARDVNLSASGIYVNGDSVAMRIGHISLKEKSGFEVEEFTVESFTIAPSGQYYDNLYAKLPDSEVRMPYMRIETGSWERYSRFIDEVVIRSEITGSKVGFRSIASFAPSLGTWKGVLEEVEATVEGTVADMKGSIGYARTRETEIVADYEIRGLPDITRTRFAIDLHDLRSNVSDIEAIMADITGRSLPDKIGQKSGAIGEIRLTGRFDGLLNNFTAEAQLTTSDGNANFDLAFVPATESRTAMHGKVAVEGIDLGHMLDVKKLGRTTFEAGIDGHFGKGSFTANTDLRLSSLAYNGYEYHAMAMNGVIQDRKFTGKMKSSDPNLEFDFDGTLDFNDSIPRYDFGLELANADLFSLNFNKKDSVSIIRGRVDAAASGRSLDDLNGRIIVGRMLYANSNDSTRTGRMEIRGENNAAGKRLTFTSGFADAEYRGRRSYKETFAGLREMLLSYAPTLAPREYDPERKKTGGAADPNNFSTLNVNIKQANNIAAIFLPGFMISENSRLTFTFNPDTRYITLKANSRFIEWRDNYIDNMMLDVGNRGDSVAVYAGAADLYLSGIRMPRFSFNGGLRDNNITVQAGMSDTARVYSALMNLSAQLRRDSLSGRPQAKISVRPSRIISNEKIWTIAGRDIIADSTMIDVGSFRISGPDQSLRIYGRAGRNKSDTIHMNMSKFDLEPFSQLTSRMGYNLNGIASGHADLVSALRESMLQARIEFDSVRVNHVEFAPGLFESRWEFENNRAGMLLTGRQSGDTIIRGFFAPRDGRYGGRITLRDFDMSLLDPMFQGVISNTQGRADAIVTVRGEKSRPLFNGEIKVPSVTTTVDFMKVPYTIANARLRITDNVLSLPAAVIRDPGGNRAGFDMKVDLSSLSNVRYEFNVRPNNLMVLNTTARDNELFYGKVYASGTASIKGSKAGVEMNIRATTGDNSEFYLPITDGTTMGVSKIITFVNPHKETLDSTGYLARKRLILDRRSRQKAEGEGSNIDIAMELNVRPNTKFQMIIDPTTGDMLEGRGTGSLTLNVNPENDVFTMYGDYEITEGVYHFSLQEIIRKQFAIEEGSRIVFTGDPMDALLNVTAVYKLKTSLAPLLANLYDDKDYQRAVPVECRIMLQETLAEPLITFSVELPGLDSETQAKVASELGTQESMATQFLGLVAMNSFISHVGAGSIGTSTAMDFLANQLANILSNPYFDIGIRYTPGMENTPGNVVSVDVSTQLLSNRLLLEMEGNYDDSEKPYTNDRNSSNISGDFSITWIIDRSGHLRARGFTRTSDQFDKNQAQEHGLGLYYKEDFNTLKYIVRNFHDRFKSKKRRQAEEQARKALLEADSLEMPELDTLPPAGYPRSGRDNTNGGESGNGNAPAEGATSPTPTAVRGRERDDNEE